MNGQHPVLEVNGQAAQRFAVFKRSNLSELRYGFDTGFSQTLSQVFPNRFLRICFPNRPRIREVFVQQVLLIQDVHKYGLSTLRGHLLIEAMFRDVSRADRPRLDAAFVVMRRQQGRSNATINRDLALLSTAINYANREWDWDIPNPVRGRKLKEAEGRTRHLSREEFDRLIDAAGKEPHARHLPDFITLAVHTGCRANELLGLAWSRVDLSSDLIFLEGRHTKSGKRRSVPLNQSARRALLSRVRFKAKHCPATRWVFCTRKGRRIESVRNSFATARERAGLGDFRIHDLRHTCAAWLVSSGVPLTEVRDLLGHSTVMMTERYAHLAPENIREAVKRLDTVSRFGHGQEEEQQTA